MAWERRKDQGSGVRGTSARRGSAVLRHSNQPASETAGRSSDKADVPVHPSHHHGPLARILGRQDVHHVLAPQRVPQVAEAHARALDLVGLVVGIGPAVDGEAFVVAERVDVVAAGQEAGAVDGRRVVDDLEERVVLVRNGRVVDVDEAVGAAGEEGGGLGGVEAELAEGMNRQADARGGRETRTSVTSSLWHSA
jgi:hypothetical protein